MLTVDFDRLGVQAGDRVLDMGCGAGRHAFELYRRGTDVIAFDQDADELAGVRDLFVRGGFNDWGNPTPSDVYKLQFLGGKAYSVSAPINAAGTYDFKVTDPTRPDRRTATRIDACIDGLRAAGILVPLTLMVSATSTTKRWPRLSVLPSIIAAAP